MLRQSEHLALRREGEDLLIEELKLKLINKFNGAIALIFNSLSDSINPLI